MQSLDRLMQLVTRIMQLINRLMPSSDREGYWLTDDAINQSVMRSIGRINATQLVTTLCLQNSKAATPSRTKSSNTSATRILRSSALKVKERLARRRIVLPRRPRHSFVNLENIGFSVWGRFGPIFAEKSKNKKRHELRTYIFTSKLKCPLSGKSKNLHSYDVQVSAIFNPCFWPP